MAVGGQPWRDLSSDGRRRALARIAAPVQSGRRRRYGRHGERAEPEPMANRHGGFMRRFVVLIGAALVMMSCSPEQDVTGSIHNKCATELYSRFNPKAMDQCMA